jgi:ribulose-phosphate 3-epimerase
MIKVIPAIIPHTKQQMEEEIKIVAKFAPLVQIDISDGTFTKTKTWPFNEHDVEFFEELKNESTGWPYWEDVDIELHLMIRNPEETILDWIRTGATSFVVHIEATSNFQAIIDLCRLNSVSIGVALKPSTDIDLIAPFVPQVDFIQVMGSDLLGHHGLELDPRALEVIKTLHHLYPERIIAIDIGVKEDTAETLVDAGATKLVSGSTLLDAPSPESFYRVIESLDQ